MANFPTSTPSQRSYSTTEHLSDMAAGVGHIALHQSHEAELAAISNKIGTGASTPSNGKFLVGDGSGTSAWRSATSSDVGLGNVDNTSDATKKSDILTTIYPVGGIYISTLSANPNTLLGFGTWSAFGAGRVMVGFDSTQTEFDTVEETGGEKTHTLTSAEMPSHTHTNTLQVHANVGNTANGQLNLDDWAGSAGPLSATDVQVGNMQGAIASTGGDGAHNNLQPYIVVYMWKRTA